MARPTTPHTQTEQNQRPDRTDIEPDQLEQTSATGPDAQIYENREGAQTGTNRGPAIVPQATAHPNVEQPAAAQEGTTTTRAPKKVAQGISSHAASKESERQEKVVNERPDAKAGVNRNR